MEVELKKEDRVALRDILLGYRMEGEATPLLPLDVDIDGDGLVDAWGLDENDEVVLVSGSTLASTVYVSDGDDAIKHEAE